MDHLGETARTITTSGKRYDSDTDNFVTELTTSTLQGSVGDGTPNSRRGYRLDAEAAGGNQLIVSALTVNSAGRCGPDDNEAQANRLITVEPATFVKAMRPHGPDDLERWEVAAAAPTLNGHEYSDVRTPTAVLDAGIQPEGGCGCCPVDPQPDSHRFGAMGNAVSVPVIEWIGHRLYDEVMLEILARADSTPVEAAN